MTKKKLGALEKGDTKDKFQFGSIMPFTPFHFGPGLIVGLLLLSFIDFATFLIASVIVDV